MFHFVQHDKQKLTLLFFLFSFSLSAQESNFKKFQKLSCPEKRWVFFHPFIAKKCFKLTQIARKEADSLKYDNLLDKDWNGGQVDAFRHSYWMALLAQKVKVKKAYKLGVAHEKGNKIDWKKGRLEDEFLADSVACEMDLANNNVGLAIGCNYKNLSNQDLKHFIIQEIKKGKMKIILKNSKKEFLECNGSLIDLQLWKARWNIPKCLVPSG